MIHGVVFFGGEKQKSENIIMNGIKLLSKVRHGVELEIINRTF